MRFPMNPGRRLSLSLLAFLAGGEIAHADTYSYSGYSVTNQQFIQINTPLSVAGYSGQIAFSGSGPNAGVDIMAWCLDIFTDLRGSGTYSVGSLTTAGSGGANPSLTMTQIGEIGALMVNGSALIHSAYDVSAATQLAIWQVEYGAAFTFQGVSSSVVNLAQQFLNEVAPGGTLGPVYTIKLLTGMGPGNQAQGFAVTPLPSTWTMMLIGLAGFGFVGYRGMRRSSVAKTA
jgi:hypothetical protein